MGESNASGSEGNAGGSGNQKMVPENDLIALKNSHEKELGELSGKLKASEEQVSGLQTQLTEANRKAEESAGALNAKLQEMTAAKEKLEAQLKDSTTSAEELNKSITKVNELTDTLKKKDEALLESKKRFLVEGLGVAPATIDGKTVEQLDTFEAALKELGIKNKTGYDTSGGGGSGGSTPSLREVIDEAKSRK